MLNDPNICLGTLKPNVLESHYPGEVRAVTPVRGGPGVQRGIVFGPCGAILATHDSVFEVLGSRSDDI